MKKLVLVAAILSALVSCKKEKEAEIASTEPQVEYAVFGDSIVPVGGLTYQEMTSKFGDLVEGDTIDMKFTSTIKEVCQKKGCWMSVALDNDKETFVKFKDYAFFVPKNADKSEAIVSGRAYMDSISVNDLRHFAKDGGKSEAEIAQITTPEVKYSFQADGVLIQK